MRGRNKISAKLRRKQKNVVDAQLLKLKEKQKNAQELRDKEKTGLIIIIIVIFLLLLLKGNKELVVSNGALSRFVKK